MIENIDYHITEKCNKKCVSCGNFMPLVPRYVGHKSLAEIEEDLKVISRFPNLTKTFTITGGECTLHPELREIVLMTIKYLKGTHINIVSNATQPQKLIDLKDIILKNDNVDITITTYDIDNWNTLLEAFNDNNHLYWFVANNLENENGQRIRFHRAFFCEQTVTSLEEARKCYSRHNCAQYYNKKLYLCQYLANYHYLTDYFKDEVKVKLNADEFIDLEKVSSVEEINNFIDNWVCEPCFHCLDALRCLNKYFNDQELTETKYELNEWYIKSINQN